MESPTVSLTPPENQSVGLWNRVNAFFVLSCFFDNFDNGTQLVQRHSDWVIFVPIVKFNKPMFIEANTVTFME